ncbi:kinesin family protein [Talaromyces stipitatus ATCC 10500]|uniref:Kinesin-like protein n=1 Tax=Talaromyces stipitatus (strain ATCC 10500 / CBS 375.48 / QM 6759 / NRRL 1006) TaxID=441959 RepID=B8MFF1_TALSN|nr:kinesin family protein [Talaromyces stipitatus ATCC 10500]EED16685.1 kinesin family protein [Talaromyces stipitatus ATCC 10500]
MELLVEVIQSLAYATAWRPLSQSEAKAGEIDRKTQSDPQPLFSVSVKRQASSAESPWKSSAAFHTIFDPEDSNYKVYTTVVWPLIDNILKGENCSFFGYGHSGSGKTHTILGYDFQDTQQLGLCLAAAKQLFDALQSLNKENKGQQLGIGLSVFELRNKSAFDLLNNRAQCHIREGSDGKVHVRGETEVLEGGKVRVRPIVQRPCWEFESFKRVLVQALGQRATGSSSVHDQSSRTHAVLELEIVSQVLLDSRHALYDRQSELVPVGKLATDIRVEEESKGFMQTPDGKWAPNPDYKINQERIDAAEAEKDRFEARVKAAEEDIETVLKLSGSPCLGAKMVFVDLAGAEYYDRNATQMQTIKQAAQERQEGRQINSDLLALKEVMRAWAQNQKRIPFRSSTLTMVLREHFMSTRKGNSGIIVTLSPATEQYEATLNSLKYASLVGAAVA